MIGLGVVAVGALAAWLLGASDAAAPVAGGTRAPGASAPDIASAPLSGPVDLHQHPLAVTVLGCRNQPAAGAHVVALVGERSYAATSDREGRATVLVPDDAGAVVVSARIGRHTSDGVPASGAAVEVNACPGASVHGRVVDQDGAAVVGALIALTSEDGSYVDEVVSDDEGAYALADAQLDGRGLVVEGPDGPSPRALAPLSAAEDREVDLVVGELRDVVGWVLDMNGEPQPGVVVTMRAEKFESAWVAITGPGGDFRFANAPATPVRVDADGGELGLASARLAGSSAPRREVDLVLEPMGSITVFGPEKGGGAVAVVRCFDARYHGTDDLYTDDLDATFTETDGSPQVDLDDGGGDVLDSSDIQPSMDEMFTTMAEGLRGFDRDEPVESVKRVMLTMMKAHGGVAAELGGDGVDYESIAEMTAKELVESSPEVVDLFAKVANMLESGYEPREAFEQVGREMGMGSPDDYEGDAPPEELPEAQAGEAWTETPPPEAVEERGHVLLNDDGAVVEPAQSGPLEPEIVAEDGAVLEYPDYAAQDVYMPPTDAMTMPEEDRRAVATRGPLGARMMVRASYAYQVHIKYADGTELFCGRVFVDPGADAVVRCGAEEGEGHVVGRVVDTKGAPIAGIMVSEGMGEATTGPDGRFDLTMKLWSTSEAFLTATDPSGAFAASSLRNINATAGEVTEVGDLVMRRPEEAPVGSPTADFGGIGGLVALDETGLRLDDLEPDSPLALAGAERGDVITMVDGVSAAELSMDELLVRLRGEVGSHVQVRLRNSAGEVYELDLERAMIQVGPDKWSRLDAYDRYDGGDEDLPQFEY
ncbi:MAG: carboxypeptidase regulatory-like domain-containing protein [Deltaproteobacteria bacterium]|nr:carboxypeptidase regulatory-like domain-containing protein [Deltaproteobacteria bacterium]